MVGTKTIPERAFYGTQTAKIRKALLIFKRSDRDLVIANLLIGHRWGGEPLEASHDLAPTGTASVWVLVATAPEAMPKAAYI